MAQFVAGRPLSTELPRIDVDAGLKPGVHRFRLVVVNDAGLSSQPDEVLVQVALTAQPGAQPILRPAAPPPAVRTRRHTPRTPR